jgi:NAD-dependent DNA ligase
VRRLDLHVGDTVTVEKAGEIIPQVVAVDIARRPADAKPIHPPKKCPECAGEAVQDEGGVYLRCINPACPAQIVEKLRFFCARDQMDIAQAGPELLDKLVSQGLVRTAAQLYKLGGHRDTLAAISFPTTFGQANTDKLLEAIETHRTQATDRVLTRMRVPFLSEPEVRLLAGAFPTLEELAKATPAQLRSTKGIGPLVADEVYAYLNPSDSARLARNLKEIQKRLRKQGRLEGIGIAGLGEGRIDRLVSEGLVRRYADLFALRDKRNQLAAMQFETTLGKKNADALLRSIEQSKSRPLSRVLASLNIRHVGLNTAELLAEHFGTIDALLAASEGEIRRALSAREDDAARRVAEGIHAFFRSARCTLEELPSGLPFAAHVARLGIPVLRAKRTRNKRIPQLEKAFTDIHELARAPVESIQEALEEEKRIARSVYDYFRAHGGRSAVEELRGAAVNMIQPSARQRRSAGPLADKTIVVTGSFDRLGRKGIEKKIKALGGKVGSSVSGNTDFVVCGASPGSKLTKAQTLGIQVIDEDEFIRRFGSQ